MVGAGLIGLGIAWELARRGVGVTVLDPEPGTGASEAAAGMLAPVTEAHYGEKALLALNLASARRWASFAEELADASGADPGYRTCGTITVARDLDDAAALAELHAFQQRLGLETQRLTASEVRTLEPFLSPRIRAGLSAPEDHQVDNRALVTALIAAAQRAGVEFNRRAAVRVACNGGAVTGVVLDDATHVPGDAVVLAAGTGTGGIGGIPPGVIPPIRPVKGQLLHLRGRRDQCPHAGVVRGLDVYVVSRGDGRVVVGATMEERGTDTTVTAGAVLELLRAAWELLPGIAELELTEATAGLRPATPDNAPVLGPTAVEGLHLATGHFRNGILLAPVTADEVAAGLGDDVAEVIRPFAADRFRVAEVQR